MTCDEVQQLYADYCAADEEHRCPEREGEDFVRCEICEHSRQAHDRLMFSVLEVVELLEREREAKNALIVRVIQDVDPQMRTPELQQAMLYALHMNKKEQQHVKQ